LSNWQCFVDRHVIITEEPVHSPHFRLLSLYCFLQTSQNHQMKTWLSDLKEWINNVQCFKGLIICSLEEISVKSLSTNFSETRCIYKSSGTVSWQFLDMKFFTWAISSSDLEVKHLPDCS
jgi:hypothetical protein